MKAAAIVLASLLMLSGVHVTVPLAGCPVAVPVPLLVLAAELAVIGLLGWVISRSLRGLPLPSLLPWRTS